LGYIQQFLAAHPLDYFGKQCFGVKPLAA